VRTAPVRKRVSAISARLRVSSIRIIWQLPPSARAR
jgi:hypothetical protein